MPTPPGPIKLTSRPPARRSRILLAAIPNEAEDRYAVRPRIVTRVIDAIHAEPDRPWTAAEMAEVAGVSVRRLQEGFRISLGKTPRECLTEIRLAGVRTELASGAACSVTDVALKWGFTHFGRFAAAFRQRYGVPPSSLLHRPLNAPPTA